MRKLTVACVLRSGGHYAVDYVEKLKESLAVHTPSAELVCLSDVPVPCTRIPLLRDWPGWWSKLELFRPGLFEGTVMYVDLDTIITGDITPLFAHDHRFTALTNPMHPEHGIGSGVMAWRGDYSYLYEMFARNPKLHMERCKVATCWGDQGFIQSLVPGIERWQELFPGMVQSVKIQEDRGKSRIVYFHGNPRPRDVNWSIPNIGMRPSTKGFPPRITSTVKRRAP